MLLGLPEPVGTGALGGCPRLAVPRGKPALWSPGLGRPPRPPLVTHLDHLWPRPPPTPAVSPPSQGSRNCSVPLPPASSWASPRPPLLPGPAVPRPDTPGPPEAIPGPPSSWNPPWLPLVQAEHQRPQCSPHGHMLRSPLSLCPRLCPAFLPQGLCTPTPLAEWPPCSGRVTSSPLWASLEGHLRGEASLHSGPPCPAPCAPRHPHLPTPTRLPSQAVGCLCLSHWESPPRLGALLPSHLCACASKACSE